jgi:ligand-binding sensor domain-containing protein/signal transduction histidine kinase
LRSSNIFRNDFFVSCRRLSRLLICLAFACAVDAREPAKFLSQYVRERWGSEKGFPSSPVYAITQTPDGYLWLGTEKGLVRFDGLNFHLFEPSDGANVPIGPILGLVADSDGNLWVRQQAASILRYHAREFETVSKQFEQTEAAITAMGRGSNGQALFSGLINGIFRYKDGTFATMAAMPAMSNFLVISLAEMKNGRVLVGTRDTGLFQFDGRQLSAGPSELRDRKINCLLVSDDQNLWIGSDNGLLRWNGTESVSISAPPGLVHAQILALAKDRHSNIWIGTADGLVRMDSDGHAAFDDAQSPPTGAVTAIFEDREGNVWTGSAKGLERFHDSAFTSYSVLEGLPSESNGPLYVDSENRTWFAPLGGGLYWLKEGKVEKVKSAGLDKDIVYSVAGGGGELWVGRQRGGLTRLQLADPASSSMTYTQANGLPQNSVYAVQQTRDGTVWAATVSAGVSRLKDGKFTAYTSADGLLSNSVAAILEGSDGTMWFATPRGLSAFSNGRWQSFTVKDGLPSEDVICLLQDQTGTLFLGTSKGIAAIRSGRVWIPQEVPDSLREPVFGIEADRLGGLWIVTASGVFRVERDALFRGRVGSDDLHEYDLADGLRSTDGVRRNRSLVSDALGRIWISMNRGISFVDPVRAMSGSVPALVHIEGLFADGSAIRAQTDPHIPGARKRVTCSFAGLSLSAPGRVRYKYKLDSFDQDWSEPVTEREASYTNLGSGSYLFHVIASNSDGVWNSTEASVSFTIDPVFWQTWWFRLSGFLVVCLVILLFFRLRMLRLTRQMQIRMDERVGERTRIARELHDSLLQGFQGLIFRLQAVRDMLPARPTEAAQALESALERADHVIAEGRGTVEDLRSSTVVNNDLVQAVTALGQELVRGNDGGSSTNFRITVEGAPRALEPILRDDVYRIAREALRNAATHAQAKNIEAEMTYGDNYFLLRIRDDGNGIDQKYLNQGSRAGHWGLPGMSERAKRFGGRLAVWSEQGAGTEIELTVPAAVAYGSASERRRFWFSRK